MLKLKNVSRITAGITRPLFPTSHPSSQASKAGSFDPSRRVGVFWDTENTGRFLGRESIVFLAEVKRRINRPINFIRMYEDISVQTLTSQYLQESGVHCVRFSAKGRKEIADHLITSNIFAFAFEHPEATIVVVTRDSDFAYPLHLLAQRGHEIILVSSNRTYSSNYLTASASQPNFHCFYDIARVIQDATQARTQLQLNLEEQKKKTSRAAQVTASSLNPKPTRSRLPIPGLALPEAPSFLLASPTPGGPAPRTRRPRSPHPPLKFPAPSPPITRNSSTARTVLSKPVGQVPSFLLLPKLKKRTDSRSPESSIEQDLFGDYAELRQKTGSVGEVGRGGRGKKKVLVSSATTNVSTGPKPNSSPFPSPLVPKQYGFIFDRISTSQSNSSDLKPSPMSSKTKPKPTLSSTPAVSPSFLTEQPVKSDCVQATSTTTSLPPRRPSSLSSSLSTIKPFKSKASTHTPRPGPSLFTLSKAEGWLVGVIDWVGYLWMRLRSSGTESSHGLTIINMPNLSREGDLSTLDPRTSLSGTRASTSWINSVSRVFGILGNLCIG
ncbi:hypothetical protein BDY24DRAFT_436404 [Mrakia frigida]|uniref:uncharacterized protein n=1 Tax=Mrakia frigida TaxID=29902 RepID=UPI003FCC0038